MLPFDLPLKTEHIKKERQNWMENDRTSNLFCHSFTVTLIYKPSLKSIRPKLAILSQKTPKTHKSGHISKLH